jgi:O-antigen ligase
MTLLKNLSALKNQGVLARLLIPVATIALAIVLASRIEQLEPILPFVLAGMIGLAGAGIAVRYGTFPRGIILVMLTAGLVNFFTLPTGRDSRIVISLAISLVLLVIWGWQLAFSSRTHVRIQPSPINKPLLLYVIINIIAYVWSLLIRDPLLVIWPSFPLVQIAALLVNISLPLMALLTANKIDHPKWLHAMLWVLVGLGTVNVVSRLFNLPTLGLIYNGSLGVFASCVAASASALLLFHTGLKPWHKLLLLALLAGSVLYYFIQTRLWLSGWLPMFVAIAVVTLIKSRRLFLLLVLVGLIIGLDRLNDLYQSIVVANVDEGGLERLEIWAVNIDHVLRHPLFGSGPGGYAVYYMTYNPTTARSTHNNYFDVLAQNGFVGLLAFLVMMATIIIIGIKTIRQVKRQPGEWQDRNMAFAAASLAITFSSLVAMMLGDWILPFAYNQTITGFDSAIFAWLMMGGMIALHRLTAQPREPHHA